MNFLKKYLTFHICAILGISFILYTFCIISLNILSHGLDILQVANESYINILDKVTALILFLFPPYFLFILMCENIIKFLSEFFFKKDLSIKIENKYYNTCFLIGISSVIILLFFSAYYTVYQFLNAWSH